MTETENTPSIYAALINAQKAMGHATLDSENPHFKSKYASLKSVIDAVKGPLSDNGLTFFQTTEPCEGGVKVSTVIAHESGERIESGFVEVPVVKQDAHGYGAAQTYARRYSLALACGISADTDDDGNANQIDLHDYNQVLRELWASISAIKEGIAGGNYEEAGAAWFELSETEKRQLWRAPTKGGIFTTKEREVIKEDLRKAYYRDAE